MVGKSILLVDGNVTSRRFIANILHEKQFEISEASFAKEALIFAWRDEPDLILFDPVFPDLQPEEFIHKLLNDPRTSHTPLIALSSDAGPVLREICMNAGVTEYIVKSSQAMPALEAILQKVFMAEAPVAVVEKPVEPVDEKTGLLIVFLSAKGGTGTSSLCANLAMNIKRHQPDARAGL